MKLLWSRRISVPTNANKLPAPPYCTTKPLKFDTFDSIIINEASGNTDKTGNLFTGSLWKSNKFHSSYITASCSTELQIVCKLNQTSVRFWGLMFGAAAYSLGPKWSEPFETFRGFHKLVHFLLHSSQLRFHHQSLRCLSPHWCRTGAQCGAGPSPSADAF